MPLLGKILKVTYSNVAAHSLLLSLSLLIVEVIAVVVDVVLAAVLVVVTEN